MLTTVLRRNAFFSCSLLCSNARTLTGINNLRLRVGNERTTCNGVHNNSLLLKIIWGTTTVVRCKSSEKKTKWPAVQKDEDDDEEGYEEDDSDESDDDSHENLGKGVSVKKYKVATMRIDSFLKMASGMSRKKIEDYFYEKKIWINGKLLLKKGSSIRINDEIDIIKEDSPDNPGFLNVKRFEILNINKDEDDVHLLVTVRKTKSLMIEK